jgi:quercetin dioxygenase-like cupin family protein
MTTTRTENEKACYGKAENLAALVSYAEGSIVSRTLVDKPVGTITLFAFDKGQRLSEHSAPYDAVVQVIDGTGEVMIAGKPHTVNTDEMIIMPANIPHSVNAVAQFKMLLTMIRHKEV